MKSFIFCVVVLGGICSSQATLTSSEKHVAGQIANHLVSHTGSSMMSGLTAFGQSEEKKLDFMLILDSSGSIGSDAFYDAKEATKLIVDCINTKHKISSAGSRVGLIQFSSLDKTKVIFEFGDYNSVSKVKREIGKVKYLKGWTATNKALTLAEMEFSKNGRPSSRKSAWILTDGKSNSGGSPIAAAERLKYNSNVKVCAVAIGEDANMEEINAIASYRCAFQLTTYAKFKEVMEYVFNNELKTPLEDANPITSQWHNMFPLVMK